MGLMVSTALVAGRNFFSNVEDAANLVSLNQYGNFGSKSKKKGSKSRVFETDNPARTAYDFQSRAARGYVSMTKIKWGQVMTLSDGTIITYRMRSSSKDHTPVVELQVHNMSGIRSQKIHFIPGGQMSGVNKTINADGMRVLRGIVDEAIVSLEAVIVARDNVAWGVVRLNTTLGPVEVRNRIEELPVNDEGEMDEFGVLSVMVANGVFVVDDVDQKASVCSLDEMVTGITLINGRVVTYEDGEAIADRSYTQAIVFELASGEYLVLDKGTWFSEMITINMGPEPSVFISDDSEDWEDDPEEPSIHYGWERAFVRV